MRKIAQEIRHLRRAGLRLDRGHVGFFDDRQQVGTAGCRRAQFGQALALGEVPYKAQDRCGLGLGAQALYGLEFKRLDFFQNVHAVLSLAGGIGLLVLAQIGQHGIDFGLAEVGVFHLRHALVFPFFDIRLVRRFVILNITRHQPVAGRRGRQRPGSRGTEKQENKKKSRCAQGGGRRAAHSGGGRLGWGGGFGGRTEGEAFAGVFEGRFVAFVGSGRLGDDGDRFQHRHVAGHEAVQLGVEFQHGNFHQQLVFAFRVGRHAKQPLRVAFAAHPLFGVIQGADAEHLAGGVEQFGPHHIRHFHAPAQPYILVNYDIFEYGVLLDGYPDSADAGFAQGHSVWHAVQHAAVSGFRVFGGGRRREVGLFQTINQLKEIEPDGINTALVVVRTDRIVHPLFTGVAQSPLQGDYLLVFVGGFGQGGAQIFQRIGQVVGERFEERAAEFGQGQHLRCFVLFCCNYLAGSLSGPKSPIFRHTSQFFLTVALLRPAKNRFVWQKIDPLWSQPRPAK